MQGFLSLILNPFSTETVLLVDYLYPPSVADPGFLVRGRCEIFFKLGAWGPLGPPVGPGRSPGRGSRGVHADILGFSPGSKLCTTFLDLAKMMKQCQKINLQDPQRNRNATANCVNLIRISTVRTGYTCMNNFLITSSVVKRVFIGCYSSKDTNGGLCY